MTDVAQQQLKKEIMKAMMHKIGIRRCMLVKTSFDVSPGGWLSSDKQPDLVAIGRAVRFEHHASVIDTT